MGVLLTFVYGMQANFCINAMHELGHGFVFRTKVLNAVFMRIFSFLGWLHPDMFFSSHLRHHRFTQNPPLDQENPMPIRYTLEGFLQVALIDVKGAANALIQTTKIAMGITPCGYLGWLPEWEETIIDRSVDEMQRARLWARMLLLGHGSIFFLSWWYGVWLCFIVCSAGPFYGGWLFFLCNSTQHVGLDWGSNDFRRNCRTFLLNPFLQRLYWHMNYHIEHHSYPAVPCYHLAALHLALKDEMPTPANGLWDVWMNRIIPVLSRQSATDNERASEWD